MEPVTIAVSWPLSDDLMDRIRAAAPGLRLAPITDLAVQENKLLRRAPGSEEQQRATAALDEQLHDAQVLLSAFRPPANIPARTPKLRWVQVIGAGVERILQDGPLGKGITLTNARGMAARPIAEWVLGVMLMFAKAMPVWARRKAERAWDRTGPVPFSLEGKTVGVLGLGAIGSEVARLSRVMGMRVLATRRSAQRLETGGELADEVHPPSSTHDVLRASDFVVIALPLTQETFHAIGARELGLMKPNAYLVNVGRGPIVDESALANVLREGRIAGAGLDVFEQEPLPHDSPLWALDNVIFAPHVSGEVDDYDRRVVDLFTGNLRRFLQGQPLLNVVDQEVGY